MGYKAESKLLTAALRRLEGRSRDTESNTASRKAANEKKRKRMKQIAAAVKRWRKKHRAKYNAQMRAYQAKRKRLATENT